MKRFFLQRDVDISGVSGIGNVAEGIQFDSDWCAMVWLTPTPAMSWYPNIKAIEDIHGHHGCTKIVWVDNESANVVVHR